MVETSFEEIFVDLYSKTLIKEQESLCVPYNRITSATRNMIEAYKAHTWQHLKDPKSANYSDPEYRCAYLHKYAALHTGLVCEMLLRATEKGALSSLGNKGVLNLCSLGGGPGVDILAFITFLELALNHFPTFLKVSVIDCHLSWRYTFSSILKVLMTGNYGRLSRVISKGIVECDYVQANLLHPFQLHTRQAISSADILTMVKFVSAAACANTGQMIQKIFKLMKPGSIVLFIDNAAGGFYETVKNEASYCNLQSIYGPLLHELYQNDVFRVSNYGFESLSRTRVTVQFWMKRGYNQVYDYSFQHSISNFRPKPFYRKLTLGKISAHPQSFNIILEDEEKDSPCCVIS